MFEHRINSPTVFEREASKPIGAAGSSANVTLPPEGTRAPSRTRSTGGGLEFRWTILPDVTRLSDGIDAKTGTSLVALEAPHPGRYTVLIPGSRG